MHQAVDDAPYGGGPGMVMRPQVWGEALDAVVAADPRPPRLVVPTPAGRPFTQATAASVGGRAAAGVRVRPVRGHRPARRRRGGVPDAGRRGEHRRLRARRRRGGRAGDGRGGRPAAARSAGQPRSRPPRTPSPTGCSRARPTRGRRSGGTVRFPRCCAAATMPRSRGGAATGRWSGRRRDGPSCSPRCPTTPSTPRTGRPAGVAETRRARADFTRALRRLALWTGCRRPTLERRARRVPTPTSGAAPPHDRNQTRTDPR